MFHSAECQIQCPITQQIKAKGPPPLPLWLIIEMPQYTSQKEMGMSEKKETRMFMHTHTHNTAINTADKEAEGLRVALSNPVCLFQTESLCYARHTHTEASQCSMENSCSEHYRNVKIKQAGLRFLCVDNVCN